MHESAWGYEANFLSHRLISSARVKRTSRRPIPQPSGVSFCVHRALVGSRNWEIRIKGAAMGFYEKGPVRIHFEEKGSGFPLLMIAGGGLNSAIPNLSAP
jgi:hypothetical protein